MIRRAVIFHRALGNTAQENGFRTVLCRSGAQIVEITSRGKLLFL